MQSLKHPMPQNYVLACYTLYKLSNGCLADGKPAMRLCFRTRVAEHADTLLFATDQWEAEVNRWDKTVTFRARDTDIIEKVVKDFYGIL